MTEPSVEEIVARCETYQYSLPRDEQRALIASWRGRGDALLKLEAENFALAANQCDDGYGDEYGNHQCRRVDRAVKEAEHLAGEANRWMNENRRLREALEEALEFIDREAVDDRLGNRIRAALAAEPASREAWLRPLPAVKAAPFVFDTGEEPAVRTARRQRMEADDAPPPQGDVEA